MLRWDGLAAWLLRNGFTEDPRKADGHRRFRRGSFKIQIVSHGSMDMGPAIRAAVIRQLERAGFEKKRLRRELL